MGRRTRKIGAAGRLGPRYGTKLRKRMAEVEVKLKRAYKCPSCGAEKLKRVGSSIWQCSRCGVKLAGAAYSPSIARAPVEAGRASKEGGR